MADKPSILADRALAGRAALGGWVRCAEQTDAPEKL